MAAPYLINLASAGTVMITTNRVLRFVAATIAVGDELTLKYDKDAITTNSPTLLTLDGGAQSLAIVVPMDIPIAAGEVIKNVGANSVALIFG